MKAKIKILVNHDYLSVVTPNGRFTLNRSGYKASGLMCVGKTFNNIAKHVDEQLAKGLNNEEALKTLLDEKTMSKLFPDWNKEDIVYTAGQTVKLISVFAKKYPSNYEIVEVKRKTIYLNLNGQKIGINRSFIELI